MTSTQARNQAIGAVKNYVNNVLKGITLIQGKNLIVDSIVYNDVDKQTEVNVSWTADDGTKKTDTVKIPYGNGYKDVDIEADAEGYNYFVFTDDKDIQTKVKLPDGLKVKLSEKEGNAITQEDDGLYVSLTGVKISTKENNALENLSGDDEGLYVEGLKISEAEGNKLEKKDDGLFSSGVDVSAEKGNQIQTKYDGIYVEGLKISEGENNLIESKEDGLFATVPISSKDKNKLSLEDDGGYYAEGVTVSRNTRNIIEERDDGIYVENITIEKTALADNTTKCDFKYKDTLLNSFILDNKSTLISGHVQQFGSAETVNVYKYVSGGVTVLSTTLIESTSDNTIVYDSNLRKFGVIKVDGDKFYIIGKEAVKFDIDVSIVAEPKTLHNEGFNLVLVLDNEDYNVYVDVNGIMSEITRAEFDDLKNTVASIQLNQYPNAIIHGSPSIMHGQVSGFSESNYLEFPFIVNFENKEFIISMCFNTSDDITNQQNIIDGLGLALAIKDSGFLLALSSTGITFDIGIFNSSPVLTANTTYYVQFKHSNNQYILSYSTNKIDYTDVITVDSPLSLYPVKTIIGVGDLNTAQPKPFKGIIDFNYCNLIVAGDELWQGIKSTVNVSKEENNAIKMLVDGLYVEETKISEEKSNTLKLLDDGLFSGKEIISIKREDYNKLTPEEKQKDVLYNVYDDDESKALVIDDNNIDKATLWSSFKISAELEKIPVKTELLNIALTEEQILDMFVQSPNVNYSGFFYNISLASYCSFNGLYISKNTSGTEVHYGEVEIKGIHDKSDYSIDYRCDWEDGATWYKVINANINDESTSENDTWSAKKINDSLVDKVPFKFGITEDGKYGYIKDGADTVTPFKSGSKYEFFATSSDNFNTEEDMYNAIIVLGRNTTPTLKVGGVTINATEKVYYGGYVSRFEKIDYIPKGTNIITQGRGFIIHEVPPIDSGSEKITTTGGFAPNSASTFVLGKDCDEINVTLGFITSMYTVVVDGVDMTSSFQNYGYNVNGVGLSQGTLKGDFHSGTELVVTNKSAGGVLGYTITY